MKVLLLYDGSENAKRAVDFAGRLVKLGSGGQISLLRVVEFWQTGAWGFFSLPEEKQEEMINKATQQAKADLEKAKATLAENGAIVDVVVLVGEPVAVIMEYAKEMLPDVIVMGSRGSGPIREVVLGGICHKVLQLAQQPVVVVK